MKKLFILLLIFLASCSLNKVVNHHGVHNLEKKQKKLIVNFTNKNEIYKIIGPPSTKNTFDNDLYIYIEKKTSNSKLIKLGKRKIIVNNVLILELDNKGILVNKNFFDINDMKNIKFDNGQTKINYSKRSFIYNFLSTLRQKVDDPLGKKRIINKD